MSALRTWLRGSGVVFRKEVVDNLRDRRAASAALLYPLLGPAILVLVLVVVGKSVSSRVEKPLALPVAGAEHAPALVAFLEQHGAKVEAAPGDPEAAVKAGDADVVLVIEEGFGADFAAGEPATLRLVVDDSRQSAMVSVTRAENLLAAYGSQIATLRLLARGVSPQVVEPLAIERRDVATPQSQAARFLGMAPYFLIFSVFLAGMYLAIDTTAGERERGSLEPLLIHPVSRGAIVLGKYGATLVFTQVGVLVTIAGFVALLNFMPLEQYLGARYRLELGAIAGLFVLMVPIALLAGALQILIATFTRSFKEAQTYLSLLPLAPALPGMFIAFLPIKPKLWMMLIPTWGQQLHVNQLLRGEALDPLHVAISALVTAGLGLGLLAFAIRLYQREDVVFRR